MTTYGFTGTREGMSERQRKALVDLVHHGDDFHHGSCIGADEQAAHIAYQNGATLYGHPSTIAPLTANTKAINYITHEPMPPMQRNADIVSHADVLIAAPRSLQEEQRSGTWATIRMARKRGTPVIILDP